MKWRHAQAHSHETNIDTEGEPTLENEKNSVDTEDSEMEIQTNKEMLVRSDSEESFDADNQDGSFSYIDHFDGHPKSPVPETG